MTKAIVQQQLSKFKDALQERPEHKVLERTITRNGILASAADYQAETKMTPVFSIDLDTGDVANQKQSGRCWMFAALNTMRHEIKNKFNVPKDFELSQNYTYFWDKLEKANYFYENVLATADLPTSDRKVAWLMTTPQQDGGQWDMIVAIIQKYGVVPKAAMPETYNSSKSSEFNSTFNLKLRKDAVALRKLVAANTPAAKIAAFKEELLNDVYRMLAYSFGEPPAQFDFEYRDAAKNYHLDRGLTPTAFFEKYVGWDLADYVSIINGPTADKPYNQMYTVEMLGNVVDGRQVRHLNVDMETFRAVAIKQLQSGESVWFGCDVGQESDRQKGIMDTTLYHKGELFDIDLKMTKAQRLDYAESLMTHAMVLTGVDLIDDKPTKWKVENSWGKKVGNDGFFVMSNAWMNEYCYQVVVNKKHLPAKLQEILKEKPTVLAPWDPMGSLA
ncbi:C1 family peptidase [Liquorilactobacillus satsumensis]|uniref:Aminopeptidase n=1 Tax=Liquorilactobacillus satsumensis DSM 16230 = JCM 12392 TaxID=1423801 RepID=A0A0R1VBB2_9LACO|nr:C1 family peptidase [Liquorilactobacillus satsumensis]KRM00259.1 aminopeptidase Bleomycin hydrolase [Liquorilactobacillus satsumensis DSM 16230 = JCM 12392]MCC7665820.1 aminopeptidase [Liquorilactobacillus satsumensis]MCP9356385.1 C1 family peptidase [Liquorilactobacillus satsumensis]MCP9370476.1 C1 family peptidase [Liquorilactobacillus satsumensis]